MSAPMKALFQYAEIGVSAGWAKKSAISKAVRSRRDNVASCSGVGRLDRQARAIALKAAGAHVSDEIGHVRLRRVSEVMRRMEHLAVTRVDAHVRGVAAAVF